MSIKVGRGFLGGACNKNAILRRSFQQIREIGREYVTETSYISNFYK